MIFFLVCGRLGARLDKMAKHCVAQAPAWLLVRSWTVELSDALLALMNCIGLRYSKSEMIPESCFFETEISGCLTFWFYCMFKHLLVR